MEIFEIGGLRLGCPEPQLTEKIRAKLQGGEYEGSEARAPRPARFGAWGRAGLYRRAGSADYGRRKRDFR